MRTAVKVHRSGDSFGRELAVYQRLRRLGTRKVLGLTVPRLLRWSHRLKVIQMDFVTPPYLLDFAGAHLHPPDYSDEVLEQWRAELDERFGPNVHIVYAVYDALAKHGIYYMDFRPSNMNLKGLPGAEPDERRDDGLD